MGKNKNKRMRAAKAIKKPVTISTINKREVADDRVSSQQQAPYLYDQMETRARKLTLKRKLADRRGSSEGKQATSTLDRDERSLKRARTSRS